MYPIIQLPAYSMTLRPATEADRFRADAVFHRWYSETDGRFIINPTITVDGNVYPLRLNLGEYWEDVDTEEDVAIQVRAADCGAGCRCAGEFRFV